MCSEYFMVKLIVDLDIKEGRVTAGLHLRRARIKRLGRKEIPIQASRYSLLSLPLLFDTCGRRRRCIPPS
ncbi:hypothetical protein TNCV_1242901 [Trichonephila clavipes]|nr:hypothetical protein TNCV_1242901 [Trichonephila clavipes]